jgi:hypothetical protein
MFLEVLQITDVQLLVRTIINDIRQPYCVFLLNLLVRQFPAQCSELQFPHILGKQLRLLDVSGRQNLVSCLKYVRYLSLTLLGLLVFAFWAKIKIA